MNKSLEINERSTILLVATTSFAGMGPYVVSIVNSFHRDDNVRFFLVEDDSHYYTNNVKKELLDKCEIIQQHMNKIMTLINLTIYPKYFFRYRLKSIVRDYNISMIHCLTSFHDPSFVKWFERKGKFILTVHDLIQHESKKAFYKEIRQNIFFNRMQKCITHTSYLITNSKSQSEKLKELFPNKRTTLLPFPTLITESIAKGGQVCPELKGLKDYILFFGRIEKYKGVNILLKAYLTSKSNLKLVIAGKGEFENKVNSSNIIYIDRYIKDEEIRTMYENAKYVVYPYISATQSGVLSVASFFRKPMILSDIPFFQETVGSNKAAIFFKSNDFASLSESIKSIEFANINMMETESKTLYLTEYSESSYRAKLLTYYNEI